MSASVDPLPQETRALRLHRQLAAIWATGPGMQRLAAVNHSVIGLRFMVTVVRVLRDRRRARHADARAARDAQPAFMDAGDLQPGLHDARVDDAVPVRNPDDGGHCGLPDTEDSRHARLRLPAADRLRLLVLSVRGIDPDGVAALRRRAQQRLVHVHAAELERLHAGHQRRRLAARRDLRRDLGADARRRDRRLDPEDARAGHVARPHADLRLVHPGHRDDDAGGLSAADPRLDPARGRARLRPAVLRPDAGRRCAALAASVLAVRPPGRLHHLPADGRRAVDDHSGLRQPAAGRLPGDRRRDHRAGVRQLRHLGAPHVHGGHPASRARVLLRRARRSSRCRPRCRSSPGSPRWRTAGRAGTCRCSTSSASSSSSCSAA